MTTTELCGTVGRGAGAHDESHRTKSSSTVYRYTIVACTPTHLYTERRISRNGPGVFNGGPYIIL